MTQIHVLKNLSIQKRTLVFLFLSLLSGCSKYHNNGGNHTKCNYEIAKEALIVRDYNTTFDSDIVLSKQEKVLDKRLQILKDSFKLVIETKHPSFYKVLFENIKDFIETTTLFKILKTMPKGGLLHVHSGGMTDVKWVIERAKQLVNCYVYLEKDNKNTLYGQLGIFEKNKVPAGYIALGKAIRSTPDFEAELYNLLVFKKETLREEDDYWVEFEKRFKRMMPLVNYRPFFKTYYQKSFLDLIEDQVDHVEIRFVFGNLWDEKNRTYPMDVMVEDLKEVLTEVRRSHPSFSLSLIYTSFKFLDVSQINLQLEEAFRLKRKYSGLIAGFDLVAEEDRGHTIDFYQKSWEKHDSLQRVTGLKLPLFLHAGESNSIINKNLYGAILLGPKRIGHGINLLLYPGLMEEVKQHNILVEVNPLSNQILGYVADMRNHPARIFLRNGIQCSVNSDDPGVFGYQGLTYDFFMVYMAWELNLKAIKKLVFNSIRYAALEKELKEKALKKLNDRWEIFVRKTNSFLSPQF